MKKMILIGVLLMGAIYLNAQTLLTEDFNFSGNLTGNGWSTHSGTATPILTTEGLTYVGYPGSGIGNAANVIGTSDDVNLPLTDSLYAPGENVYLTALVKVTELVSPQTGGYFLHLGNRKSANNFTAFAARVYVKTTAAGVVNFGISNSETPYYGATGFALNTTYLIIVKYSITLAPAANPAFLWVFPAGIPVSEAAAGTAEFAGDFAHTAGTDTIDAVGIRQSTDIPDVIVDGIRVSTSWLGAIGLPVEQNSVLAAKFELLGNYPNPFNPSTTISFNLAKYSKVRVAVFNVLGQELNVVANKEFNAGKVEIPFNASNLATGMYFYTVTVDGKSFTKSMTLLK